MTRTAVIEKIERAPTETLAIIDAVLDAVGRGEAPSPWDPTWAEAIDALDRAAEKLREERQSDRADALAQLVAHLTTMFPVAEAADDRTPEELAALDEADQLDDGTRHTQEDVRRQLGLDH